MSLELNILILLLMLIAINIVKKLIAVISNIFESQYQEQFLRYGLVSRSYLSKLNSTDFDKWCLELLENLGYEDVTFVSNSYSVERSLVCSKENKKYYVICSLLSLKDKNKDPDDFEAIDEVKVQRFLGELAHDKVKNSIIITNGNFSKNAIDYAQSLSENYNIRLIDGIELTNLFRSMRKNNLRSSFES